MASFARQDTFDRIVTLIAQELKVDRERVNETATFQELGADSLDMVQIIMKLEETFGIEINDQDAEKMSTLRDVVDSVQERRTL
ncbi:MAG: acyl carrier protein [Epsilonproteobacteria bacterium]|nr:acyl carrier protein [Campylobacterota bacterium]